VIHVARKTCIVCSHYLRKDDKGNILTILCRLFHSLPLQSNCVLPLCPISYRASSNSCFT
ncbi:hypothetical protein THOM_0514, partial [Trachipleistophora hominis]